MELAHLKEKKKKKIFPVQYNLKERHTATSSLEKKICKSIMKEEGLKW